MNGHRPEFPGRKGIPVLACGDVETCIGGIRAIRPLFHRELCIRCGTCADLCGLSCIHRDCDGFCQVELSCCRGCGACSQVCPQGAIEMAEVLGIFVRS